MQFGRAGQVVAVVSKQWFSLTETYGGSIAPGEGERIILACVLSTWQRIGNTSMTMTWA
jgi:uncharacterized protein YxjI